MIDVVDKSKSEIYSQKAEKHVFEIKLSNQDVYLFKALSQSELNSW